MQRVLIVDDDRLVADTLTLIFEKNGFKAKAAYSADEALILSREFAPDLLLCDVTMPARDSLPGGGYDSRTALVPHPRPHRLLLQLEERSRTGP